MCSQGLCRIEEFGRSGAVCYPHGIQSCALAPPVPKILRPAHEKFRRTARSGGGRGSSFAATPPQAAGPGLVRAPGFSTTTSLSGGYRAEPGTPHDPIRSMHVSEWDDEAGSEPLTRPRRASWGWARQCERTFARPVPKLAAVSPGREYRCDGCPSPGRDIRRARLEDS